MKTWHVIIIKSLPCLEAAGDIVTFRGISSLPELWETLRNDVLTERVIQIFHLKIFFNKNPKQTFQLCWKFSSTKHFFFFNISRKLSRKKKFPLKVFFLINIPLNSSFSVVCTVNSYDRCKAAIYGNHLSPLKCSNVAGVISVWYLLDQIER